MRWMLSLLAITLPFNGCQTRSVPPSNVASAPALGAAVNDKDSKLSANAEAAAFANGYNPEGPAKDATTGALSVVRALAGPARPEDSKVALDLVKVALSGKLVEAQKGWETEKANAATLTAKIATLEKQVNDERIKAANDLKAWQDKVLSDAEKARKRMITLIFMGGGAIFVILGVACLILIANPATAASYAFLGPKAGFCGIGGGMALISIGIAVNALERAIENHPYVFIASVAGALSLIGIAGTLIYANHRHNVQQ